MAPPLAVAWIVYGFVTLLVGAAFGYGAGHAMMDPKYPTLVPAWWRDWMTTLAAMVAALLWPVWLVVGLTATAMSAALVSHLERERDRAVCAEIPDIIAACHAPVGKYPMPAACWDILTTKTNIWYAWATFNFWDFPLACNDSVLADPNVIATFIEVETARIEQAYGRCEGEPGALICERPHGHIYHGC